MKEACDQLQQSQVMEECDPNAERRSKGRTGFDRDTACYRLVYQEEKKASNQLSLEQFFKKIMSLEVLLSIKISYLL